MNPIESRIALLIFLLSISMALPAGAGSSRKHVKPDEQSEGAQAHGLPMKVRVLQNIPYGQDRKQTMDIYLPPHEIRGAPVLFMVHGGAWRAGDKGEEAVVGNKVARWAPRGFIVISVNYRLMPQLDPLKQSEDVARALIFAQANAVSWGGDPSKFILMGHSSGAHLVDLLATAPLKALELGARPWLGTISLDSAALDVVKIMEKRHYRFYDEAFGSDEAYWFSASPSRLLSSKGTPMLVVCSTQRVDSPCLQAKDFVKEATELGVRAQILKLNLSHREINELAGEPSNYTDAIEEFMGSLHPVVKHMLAS